MGAAAAEILGDVTGPVGVLHELLAGARFRGNRDDADTDPDLVTFLIPDETIFANDVDQIFGQLAGLGQRAVLQQHAEFVAAEPRQRIAAADLSGEQRGKLLEQFVAGDVARGIVDDLELVEVEKQHRVPVVEVLRRLQRVFEAVLEVGTVGETGQRVARGLLDQLLLHAARIGNVLEHQHAADHFPLGIEHWRRGTLDRAARAVARNQNVILLRRNGALFRHAAPGGIRDRIPAVLFLEVHHRIQRQSHRLVIAPARQDLGHGIHVIDAALAVGGDDAIADGMQRDLRALFFHHGLAQRQPALELGAGARREQLDDVDVALLHMQRAAAHAGEHADLAARGILQADGEKSRGMEARLQRHGFRKQFADRVFHVPEAAAFAAGAVFQRQGMIHDVAAVAPVGQRLVFLPVVVDTGGEKHRVDGQELGEFPHQGIEIGFTGGADRGFDQAVQAILALLLEFTRATRGKTPGQVPGQSRAREGGRDSQQNRIDHEGFWSDPHCLKYRQEIRYVGFGGGFIRLHRQSRLPNLWRLSPATKSTAHGH